MQIRPETPDDHDIVREIHLDAYPGGEEAELVSELRRAGQAAISIVAEVDGLIVGHVMCSVMLAPFPALGFAPVALIKAWRNRGLTSSLVRSAIDVADAERWAALFVVGDPDCYAAYGFSVDAARNFRSPFSGPHFMVLPLGGPLPTCQGLVDYAPAFARLG